MMNHVARRDGHLELTWV